jgi:hypothetical protein
MQVHAAHWMGKIGEREGEIHGTQVLMPRHGRVPSCQAHEDKRMVVRLSTLTRERVCERCSWVA